MIRTLPKDQALTCRSCAFCLPSIQAPITGEFDKCTYQGNEYHSKRYHVRGPNFTTLMRDDYFELLGHCGLRAQYYTPRTVWTIKQRVLYWMMEVFRRNI
jgi:hypothetical protein